MNHSGNIKSAATIVLLGVASLCGHSLSALPAYNGSSDVSVGIALFYPKGEGEWGYAPNPNRDRSGRWYINGKCHAGATAFRGLFYGGKCEPAWEFSKAGDYYQANKGELPILPLPKHLSDDTIAKVKYDELVEAKKNRREAKAEAANQERSAQLYGTVKSFLGKTLGGIVKSEDLSEPLDGTKSEYEYKPSDGLAGFEKYKVTLTPRSHRVYRITAIHEGGSEEDAKAAMTKLAGAYPGLKFDKGDSGWECKMAKSEGAKAVRILSVQCDDGKCIVSLLDKAGAEMAKNEKEGRCVKCKGKGEVTVKGKCSKCKGTRHEYCEDCKGTKMAPCGDCWKGKKKCSRCHGKGKVKCMRCAGKGQMGYCSNCTDGTEERKVKCSACRGTGKCD